MSKERPIVKSLGWKPDKPDPGDFRFMARPEQVAVRPKIFDMRQEMPPVYDQGDLRSCTANAIGATLHYLNIKQKKQSFMPSRLFIYWNERNMEGTVGEDSGASIRDGIKSVNKLGACREDPTWPYVIKRFTLQPPQTAYNEALLHQALKYQRVSQSDVQIETRLSQGSPIVIGVMVYSSFMTNVVAKTGDVPMPKDWPRTTEKLEGGHAILLVGYNNSTRKFIFRNSWGTGWGKNGYGELSYNYICNSNLGSDFWTIEIVE
jgi:C1A family cysteine protease